MDVIEQFCFEGAHWTSLKLYMQQIFGRLTVVFNLIHFCCFWTLWIVHFASTLLLLAVVIIWKAFFKPRALRTLIYSLFMTTSWQFTASLRILVVDWVLSRKKVKGMVIFLDHWLCLDLTIFFHVYLLRQKKWSPLPKTFYILIINILDRKGSCL